MVNEKDLSLELPSQSLLQGESDEPVLFWQCCVGKLKQTQQAVLESAAGTPIEYNLLKRDMAMPSVTAVLGLISMVVWIPWTAN